MSKIALIAEFEIKPQHRDAFQQLMRTHAQAALDHEPGCLQFDVAVPGTIRTRCSSTRSTGTRRRSTST